ncbi:MAG: hypothetical protein JWO93_584 [Micrococcaceae bacterium]|nr:hypothetical protein [Micrococcaceae bacterium]
MGREKARRTVYAVAGAGARPPMPEDAAHPPTPGDTATAPGDATTPGDAATAPGDATTPGDASTAPGTEPRRIGVLFVHGMGVQKRGDTLRDFGDPLLTWTGAWLRGHGGSAELHGCTCRETAQMPRHQHALWSPAGEPAIEVVVAESWWSDKFPTPSASQLAPWMPSLVWSVTWRALVWIAVFIFAVVGAANLAIAASLRGEAFIPAVVAGLAAAAVIFIMPPLLLALSWIPFVQKYASAVLDFLLQWVGDVLVYEQRPIETHSVQEKITQDLRWLRDEPWLGPTDTSSVSADSVVIGAHSLGSLLVAGPIARTPNLDNAALVTFGSAIRLIKRHTRRFAEDLHGNHQDLLWLNLYDPVDFVSGYIKGGKNEKGHFPYNFKIDNCRSVTTSHGCYPDNAEQFQTAFYRVTLDRARSGQDVVDESDDRLLVRALKRRFWRSRCSSVLAALSLPGGAALALVLFGAGWPQWLAGQVRQLSQVPSEPTSLLDGLRIWIDSGGSSRASAVGVSFASAEILVLAYLWICQLAVRRMEAADSGALAANRRGRHRWRYWLLLSALFLLPVTAGVTAAVRSTGVPGDRSYSLETAWSCILLAFAPALVYEVWILAARTIRSSSLMPPQQTVEWEKVDKNSIRIGREFAFLATPNERGWKRYLPEGSSHGSAATSTNHGR